MFIKIIQNFHQLIIIESVPPEYQIPLAQSQVNGLDLLPGSRVAAPASSFADLSTFSAAPVSDLGDMGGGNTWD